MHSTSWSTTAISATPRRKRAGSLFGAGYPAITMTSFAFLERQTTRGTGRTSRFRAPTSAFGPSRRRLRERGLAALRSVRRSLVTFTPLCRWVVERELQARCWLHSVLSSTSATVVSGRSSGKFERHAGAEQHRLCVVVGDAEREPVVAAAPVAETDHPDLLRAGDFRGRDTRLAFASEGGRGRRERLGE